MYGAVYRNQFCYLSARVIFLPGIFTVESRNSPFFLGVLSAGQTQAPTTILEPGWVAGCRPWRIPRLFERLLNTCVETAS